MDWEERLRAVIFTFEHYNCLTTPCKNMNFGVQ